MTGTKIQWTHYTFNPWRGCTKVSPGCQHCYADAMSGRNPSVLGTWGLNGTRVVAAESYWRLPLKWDAEAARAGERRRVFCASLADVFEGRDTMPKASWAPVEAARARLFRLIDATPHLDWLLLTKRPERVGDLWHSYSPTVNGTQWGECVPTRVRFRRDNVWLGTSVEDEARGAERLPHLLTCRALARVLFVSAEPLLGPVGFRQRFDDGSYRDCLSGQFHGLKAKGEVGFPDFEGTTRDPRLPRIDWVIVGGESGPGARPCSVEWIRSIVRQCEAASVPCFVKQAGANYADPANGVCGRSTRWPLDVLPGGPTRRLMDAKGGDPLEWPEDLRVRQFPADRG